MACTKIKENNDETNTIKSLYIKIPIFILKNKIYYLQ